MNTKLKGIFYVNRNGKVYYESDKSIAKDEEIKDKETNHYVREISPWLLDGNVDTGIMIEFSQTKLSPAEVNISFNPFVRTSSEYYFTLTDDSPGATLKVLAKWYGNIYIRDADFNVLQTIHVPAYTESPTWFTAIIPKNAKYVSAINGSRSSINIFEVEIIGE